MRKVFLRRFIGPLLAASAPLIAVPVCAQDVPTDTGSGRSPAPGSESSEIVVTAQKREERLIDVPSAVTALSSDALIDRGALRFEDYQAYVPGLSTISIAPGFNQITLRGVTTGVNQLSATTATYFDEAPTSSSSSLAFGSKLTPDPDLLDISRIEVLRGPQGTLYGANALGGVVRFILVDPPLDHTVSRVQAGISSVEHGDLGFVARGAAGTPLIDGVLGLRASAFYTVDPGYIDNVTTGRNNINQSTSWGGRLALRLKAGESTEIRFSTLYQKRNNDGNPAETVDWTSFVPTSGKYAQALRTNEFRNTEFLLHSLEVATDMGFADLISSTTYSRQKSQLSDDASNLIGLLTGLPMSTSNVNVDFRKFSQELRLASPAGKTVEYVVGLFYTSEKAAARNSILGLLSAGVPAPRPFDFIVDSRIHTRYRETAAFANLTLNLTDRFNIQGGGRWSRNHQRFDETVGGAFFGPLAGLALTSKSAETAWTYAIAAQYRISDDANLYARAAKGFRPGGANLVPPAGFGDVNSVYESDSLMNYEAGAKAALFDRRLNLSLAAFQIDWKNIQTSGFAGPFFILFNGDRARSRGVEAEARWNSDGFTIGGNLNYTDAKTRDAIPQAGALAGEPLPYSARWSGALTADYQFALSDGVMANLGGGMRYSGKRAAFYSQPTANNPGNLFLDGYALFDLRAGLTFGKYEVSLFAQNLTDKRAILALQTEQANPLNGVGTRATIARPRTFGMLVSMEF